MRPLAPLGVLLLVGCEAGDTAHLRVAVDTALVDIDARDVWIDDGGIRSVRCALGGLVDAELQITAFDGFGQSVELTIDSYRGPGVYDAGVQAVVRWDGEDVVARGGLLGRCSAEILEGSASGVVRCESTLVEHRDGRTDDAALWSAFWCPSPQRG